jgi:hypothetical protein
MFIIALVGFVGFIYLIIVMNFSEEIEKRKKYKEWSNYTPLAEDARIQRRGVDGVTYAKLIKKINILLNDAISKGSTYLELAYYDLDLDTNKQIPFDIIKDYYESFDYKVTREGLMQHVFIKWDEEDE